MLNIYRLGAPLLPVVPDVAWGLVRNNRFLPPKLPDGGSLTPSEAVIPKPVRHLQGGHAQMLPERPLPPAASGGPSPGGAPSAQETRLGRQP